MADGSRHSLYAVEEVTAGTTPNNPALDLVRITGTTLGLNKDSLQSEEIRSDRQIADFRLGANQVAGDINFELSCGSFDQFLEAVLASADWAAPADTGATTLDATATGYERAAGSFLTDGFRVGMLVEASGYVGSGFNGLSVITAVDALTMDTTPLSGTHGVEVGGGDEQIVAADAITGGTERRAFTLVRHFADILTADKPYHILRGVEMNTLQLTIAANSMITGTLSVMGRSMEVSEDLTGLGVPTYNPASTTSPLDSFTGTLQEGGTIIAVITEITLNLQNGLEPRFVVGSKDSIDPSIARSNLTGQVTAYFENSALLDKFINETDSDIVFSLPDGDGNLQRYTIPRIKYTGGQPDVQGEGPVTLAMPFQALLDTTEGSNIRIERYTA